MENENLVLKINENQIIENILSIKKCLLQGLSEEEINNKLHVLLMKFMAVYKKIDKNKDISFDCLSISRTLIQVFDSCFYSPKYLGSIVEIIYKLFKRSKSQEKLTELLTYFFIFLIKPQNNKKKVKKFILKIISDKLYKQFTQPFYQKIVSYIDNNYLKNQIIFFLITSTINFGLPKKKYFKLLELLQMFIVGINKNYIDKILLEYSIDMFLIYLSFCLLQHDDTSIKMAGKVISYIKQIFKIIGSSFYLYNFRSKLLYILQIIYYNKIKNNDNTKNNNQRIMIDGIFNNFELDFNFLISMLDIQSYYEELSNFLLKKNICNRSNLLYLYNTYGIVDKNILTTFPNELDLNELLNKNIFKKENSFTSEKKNLTFEDCLFSEIFKSITSLKYSNIDNKETNSVNNNKIIKNQGEGYFMRTLMSVTNLHKDLSVYKQYIILSFVQKIINEKGNNLLNEWDLILKLLKLFLINKDYLKNIYKNILSFIILNVNFWLDVESFAEVLTQFEFLDDLQFSILRIKFLFQNLRLFKKHFKKEILFYHYNVLNFPKDIVLYKFQVFSLIFDKISYFFEQMQKEKEILELEKIIIQTYPSFFDGSNTLDRVYKSGSLIISQSNNLYFIRQLIETIITKFHDNFISINFLNALIKNISSMSSIDQLQIVLNCITNMVDEYKIKSDFSLINTLFDFISCYSISDDFHLVFKSDSFKYSIIIDSDTYYKNKNSIFESNALFKINSFTNYFSEGLKEKNTDKTITKLLTVFNSLLKQDLGLMKDISRSSLIDNLKPLLSMHTISQPYESDEKIYKLLIRCFVKLAFHLDVQGNDLKYSLYLGSSNQIIKENEKTDLISLIISELKNIINKIIAVSVKETEKRSRAMNKNMQLLKSVFLNETSEFQTPFSELPEMKVLVKSVILLFSLITFYFYSLYDYSKPPNEAHIPSPIIEELLSSFLKYLNEIVNDVIPIFYEQIQLFRFLLLRFLIYNYKLLSCYKFIVIKFAHLLLNITWPGQREQLIDAFGKEIQVVVFNLLTSKIEESNTKIFELTCDYYLAKMLRGHSMIITLYKIIDEGLEFGKNDKTIISDKNNKERFTIFRKEVFQNLLKWGMISGEDNDNKIYDNSIKKDWKKIKTYIQINNKNILLNCDEDGAEKEKIRVIIRSVISNREFTLVKNKSSNKIDNKIDNENEEEKQQKQINEALKAFNIEKPKNEIGISNQQMTKEKDNKESQKQQYKSKSNQKNEIKINDFDQVVNFLQCFNYSLNFKEIKSSNLIVKLDSLPLARHYISQIYYYDSNPKRNNEYKKHPDKSFYKLFSLLGIPNNKFTYVHIDTNLSITFTYSENLCTVPFHEGFSYVSILFTTSPELSKKDKKEINDLIKDKKGYFIQVSPLNLNYYKVDIFRGNSQSLPKIKHFDLLLMKNIVHIDQVANYIRQNIILMNSANLIFNDNNNQNSILSDHALSSIYLRYDTLLQMSQSI